MRERRLIEPLRKASRAVSAYSKYASELWQLPMINAIGDTWGSCCVRRSDVRPNPLHSVSA